ncbi:hypothetical protein CDAR_456631 [Caerostris darwini]|uniref:Uncharacterized protein n=1 Tax=Caerostris darwini TaxID=1538125 RepID=A0AAV4S085_9ARAC|nr:hypothetical protein CDAR_456631 [Caerostris darwini]
MITVSSSSSSSHNRKTFQLTDLTYARFRSQFTFSSMDTDQPNEFFEMIPARSWCGSKDFISSTGEEGKRGTGRFQFTFSSPDTDQPNGFFEMIPDRSWWGSKDFISSTGEEGKRGGGQEGGLDSKSFPFRKDVYAYHLMEDGFCCDFFCNFYYRGQDEFQFTFSSMDADQPNGFFEMIPARSDGLQKTSLVLLERKERGKREGGLDSKSFPFR